MPKKVHSVLIAEDEVVERAWLSKVLTDDEHGLYVVASVENGVELIESHKTLKPDIIIADICMPLMTGLEACKTIREYDKDVIIILNTAYADFDYAKKAIDLGVDGYILKPSDKNSLIELIVTCKGKRNSKVIDDESFQLDINDPINSFPYKLFTAFYSSLNNYDSKELIKCIKLIIRWIDTQENNKPIRMILINLLITTSHLFEKNPYLVGFGRAINKINFYEDMYFEADEAEARMWTISLLKQMLDYLENSSSDNLILADLVDSFLENNYNKDIKVSEIAEEFYISPSYLSTIYTEARGFGIVDKIRGLRLNHAAHLLRNTGKNISEITQESGFNNESYFYRSFKAEFGFTPTEYRKIKNLV